MCTYTHFKSYWTFLDCFNFSSPHFGFTYNKNISLSLYCVYKMIPWHHGLKMMDNSKQICVSIGMSKLKAHKNSMNRTSSHPNQITITTTAAKIFITLSVLLPHATKLVGIWNLIRMMWIAIYGIRLGVFYFFSFFLSFSHSIGWVCICVRVFIYVVSFLRTFLIRK